MDLPTFARRRILRPAESDGATEPDVLERLRRLTRRRAWLPGSKLRWVTAVTTGLSWLLILGLIVYVLAVTLGVRDTIGSHDWDQMETHRYVVIKSLLKYGQFPFWNPYCCGGHPNWGGIESGTIVVSPWLPFYLLMTFPHALRVEVWGSALLSAVGVWLLAGRFTRSPALRALVAVAYCVDGRWALQITQGHTWHLAYGWTPWVLYFFDRAVGADASRGPPRRRYAVLAGACVAMMVYMGGIYPLPQTGVLLGLYGVMLAVNLRSWRPIVAGLVTAVVGVGLAAPKLLPVIMVIRRFPRLTDSTELVDFGAFSDILTSRDQDVGAGHAGVSQWGWHEWGMYVGSPIVLLIILGLVFGRGLREVPAKWAGLVLLVLGFGSFDPDAPWPLLHRVVPVFRSQHVPSRWMYPALLMLLVVMASTLERVLVRSGRGRAWLELALVPLVGLIAYDVGTVAREPIGHMFAQRTPTTPDSTGPFHSDVHLPADLQYQYEWVPVSLTAVMANIGTTDCGTFAGFHNYFRDQQGHIPGMGAHGVGDADYRGEAFVAEGIGTATVTHWTPNEVTVEVHDAQPGEHVVLNQNWDAGWSANGKSTTAWKDTVAATLSAPDATVVFRYRPSTLLPGLGLFALTCGAIAWAWRRARRPAPAHLEAPG